VIDLGLAQDSDHYDARHRQIFDLHQRDKLVKRVLGHSDGSVTAIYNHYAYVSEMRRVLEIWANDLIARPTPLQNSSAPTDISQAA